MPKCTLLSAFIVSMLILAVTPIAAQAQMEETGAGEDCGAAGDNCQSPEFQKFMDAAVKTWPDYPMVAFRIFAGHCENGNAAFKKLCLKNPKKASLSMEEFKSE